MFLPIPLQVTQTKEEYVPVKLESLWRVSAVFTTVGVGVLFLKQSHMSSYFLVMCLCQ